MNTNASWQFPALQQQYRQDTHLKNLNLWACVYTCAHVTIIHISVIQPSLLAYHAAKNEWYKYQIVWASQRTSKHSQLLVNAESCTVKDFINYTFVTKTNFKSPLFFFPCPIFLPYFEQTNL